MVPPMGGGPNMGQMGAPKRPVSLLHEKRGRENPIKYDCSEVGELPNKVFTISSGGWTGIFWRGKVKEGS